MIYQRLLSKANIDIIHFWNQLSFEKLRTTFWTKFGIQYAPSPAKLQIKLFLFKSHSRSWPFQGIPVSHSHSQNSHFCSCYQISGMRFLIPVPKSWGCNFLFPFPLPKFGNGLSYSRSHSQNPKSHSRSPKCSPKCCQKMSKVGKMPKITISCISSWKLH